jgi:hypothetical protein
MANAKSTRTDRTVHGHSTYPSNPWDVVRYDRAGKWYIEHDDGRRELVTVDRAAFYTARNHFNPGQPGGRRFDSLVRKYRREAAAAA